MIAWSSIRRGSVGLLLGAAVAVAARGQASRAADAAAAPVVLAPADPAIAAALRQISPAAVRATVERLVRFENRSTLASMETDLKPGTGVLAAADWIAAEFEGISAGCGGCLEVRRDEFVAEPLTGPNPRIVRPTKLVNVYAVMKGTDPAQAARRVLVTGHYDSRNTDVMDAHGFAPGANDDASGVAVSLECARVLSKVRLPATVVFVAVAGEEQGLIGSRHLAQVAKAEGWELEAVLNDDIVGGDTTEGDALQDKTAVRVFSEGIPATATAEQARMLTGLGAESDSPSRELARAVVEIGATYLRPASGRAGKNAPSGGAGAKRVEAFHPVLILRRDRYQRGGDHTSFNAEGFAAVRVTEWRENFDHQHNNVRMEGGRQYGDLIPYVDFDYVANVARMNAAVLATLAAAPGAPREVRIGTGGLDNGTELSWKAPEGAPAGTSYEVVWRPTDETLWATAQGVGGATSIRLPVSKDNVVFGVRAVDAAGHRSPAVMPMPSTALRTFPAAQTAR